MASRPKVLVCSADGKNFLLRLHFEAADGEMIRFDTGQEFSKREADYRAVMLSKNYGFECDALPTHDIIAAYPKVNDAS
jgi:hypothetical protein